MLEKPPSIMSAANPLTLFPFSCNPTWTTKFSLSPQLQHRYLSTRLVSSREFVPGKSTNSRRKALMAERVVKISALGSGDVDEDNNNVGVLEQEAFIDGSSQLRSISVFADLEATLNRLSKWLVAALVGIIILWRHDAEAMWAAMGSVINATLSIVLKRIFNQKRPVSALKSDPGMPSSHAQSIFYAVIFGVLSMVEWLGVNELTVIITVVSLMFGSYLSWLRVSQRLHTISQVAVGAVLGSCFSLLWIWSWDALVLDAFKSYLWVKVSILLGSALGCLGFLVYTVRNWFLDER